MGDEPSVAPAAAAGPEPLSIEPLKQDAENWTLQSDANVSTSFLLCLYLPVLTRLFSPLSC